jgi:pimeloyl-ACP methyl ester carboxylesterase
MGSERVVQNRSAATRRPLSGAILFCVALILGCGGGDDNATGPELPADEGQTPVAGCTDGALQHGALFRVCFPADWNGDLVLYAHGYVSPQTSLTLPDDVVGGQSVSGTVTGLGYAYGTTSYRANGLVAPDAVDDLLELIDTVQRRYRPDPARTLVVGFSEGGLVATLALERHPDQFAGALTGCGPVGSFRAQLDYIDDFRVVFDYFFPGLIPGTALEIPQSVRDRWDSIYVPAIVVAFALRPDAARQLLAVTGAPTAGNDLRSLVETAAGLIWYNVFGTADAQARLGGQPFDNSSRVYSGSSDDAALNADVQRFTAEPAALAGLARFETSGLLRQPVVNLHTTGDPIVPFNQAALYVAKLQPTGSSSQFAQIDVSRYGHCTFQPAELLSAFHQLESKLGSGLQPVALVPQAR